MPTTPAADAGLAEAARLAGGQPVGSHHLLLAALADPDSAAARTLTALGINLDQAREALRNADIAGTSDEQPEERGRRQMAVRVTDGGLVLEVTDPALQALAQAAVEALGDRATEPGSIPGDLPVSASLAQVWLAMRDSLEDIRVEAAGGSRTPGGLQEDQEGGPEKQARRVTANGTRDAGRGRAGRPDEHWRTHDRDSAGGETCHRPLTARFSYCECLRYPFV